MARERLHALRYPNEIVDDVTQLVYLHLRFHTYAMGWTDSAVRRYVRDAGPLLDELNELHALRLHDPQRAQGPRARPADGRARGAHRRARASRRSWTRSARRSTASQVMEFLGVAARARSWARRSTFLLEARLDEGPLGGGRGATGGSTTWWAASSGAVLPARAGAGSARAVLRRAMMSAARPRGVARRGSCRASDGARSARGAARRLEHRVDAEVPGRDVERR